VGSTYFFLESPDEQSVVLQWFLDLDTPPQVADTESGDIALHFGDVGPLAFLADGSIDVTNSPVVLLRPAVVRRGLLWTRGEVHFLANRQGAAARLENVGRRLSKWLRGFDCVFDEHDRNASEYLYWLEGSIQNGKSLWALPSAMKELRRGRYFVAKDDTEARLDTLAKALALRGAEFPSTANAN